MTPLEVDGKVASRSPARQPASEPIERHPATDLLNLHMVKV
jgi:hypothetical protein